MTKIEGYEAYAMNWIESERGMGQRPDGFSLHLTNEDAQEFRTLHGVEGNSESYSFPSSVVFRVIVNEAVYQELNKLKEDNKPGVRRSFPKDLEAGELVR